MTQLLALVMLFIAATAFDINSGVAMTPLMVLFLLLFATAAGVVVIAIDPGAPDVMQRPPRDPKVTISNRAAVIQWLVYAATLFIAALVPLVLGPDEPKTDVATQSLTMTFAVMGLGTVFNALANRRDPASGFEPPILKALAISLFPVAMIVLATELPGLQRTLLTTSLTSREWFACLGLAALLPLVIEGWKWVRRRDAARPAAFDATRAVTPGRAR
jgi:Ca2+-transporting ATPase